MCVYYGDFHSAAFVCEPGVPIVGETCSKHNVRQQRKLFLEQILTMKKYRPILAPLTALLFYAVTDILVWQRIFETNQMIQYAGVYHTGWFVSLAGYATIGIVLMWGDWRDILYFLTSLFVGAFSGLEDILYYLLDGKPMPYSLPWLDANPMILHVSRNGVIFSAALWLSALAVLYFFLYMRRTSQPQEII